MSYLVLARKYRPQTFHQVVKQEHVTQTLANAILSKRVAHAILFAGPRGTGKTTVARILAKAMNCANNKETPSPDPCNECRSCKEITSGNATDVFEIDGASNNSVDQIRELRENIKYMPAHSPYKIYIIDEVHMLSLSAFNALLKTLEEPPAHVLFMFATTEPHKIPITILSRCQRHDLRRITLESISNHMESLCKAEGIHLSRESIDLIAREADGSMRDALSLLDQVISCSEEAIRHEDVLNILGVVDRKIIFEISQAILNGNISEIIDVLDELYLRGHDIKGLYANLIEHFRNLFVVKMGKMVDKLVDVPAHEILLMQQQVKDISQTCLSQTLDILFKEEAAIKLSVLPKIALEMAFIRMFEAKPVLPIETLIQKLDDLGKEISRSGAAQTQTLPAANRSPEKTPVSHREEKPAETERPFAPNPPDSLASKPSAPDHVADGPKEPGEIWKALCKIVIDKYPSLKFPLENSVIRGITEKSIGVELSGDDFGVSMIQRKIENLKEICGEYFGKKMDVVITVTKEEKKDIQTTGHSQKDPARHPLVADAIQLFSGKIVDVKIL